MVFLGVVEGWLAFQLEFYGIACHLDLADQLVESWPARLCANGHEVDDLAHVVWR